MPDEAAPTQGETKSDAPATVAEGTETATPETAPEGAQLGDAGMKALKAERDARKAAEKRLTDLTAEVARLQGTAPVAEPTDADALKSEIRAEFSAQLTAAAIKTEAKGRLADPADALLYVKADAEMDENAICEAIDKLLIDKPYLAAADAGAQPWGDVGGGQRETSEPEPRSAQERIARAYAKKKD